MPTRAIIQPVAHEGRYLHCDGNPDSVLPKLDRAVRRYGYDGMVERLLAHDWSSLLDDPSPGGDCPGGYSVIDTPQADAVWSYLLWPPRDQRLHAGPADSDVDVYVTGVDGRIHRTDHKHLWGPQVVELCAPLHTGTTEQGLCDQPATHELRFRSHDTVGDWVDIIACRTHVVAEIEHLVHAGTVESEGVSQVHEIGVRLLASDERWCDEPSL